MILLFELSMPRTNSWNGRWSGDERYHAITRTMTEREYALRRPAAGSPYSYSFGDGWVARVTCRAVDSREATKARKRSVGFCGYDWMVDSILRDGKILADHQRAEVGAKVEAC